MKDDTTAMGIVSPTVSTAVMLRRKAVRGLGAGPASGCVGSSASGAFGAATAGECPVALLTGDVSFLHDLSGLGAARHVAVPFALVVVQNRGGRIFEMLPVASHPAAQGEAFDHWTTPHDHDFTHAAALFGLPFVRVETRDALREALDRALAEPGVAVVEAVVAPRGAAEQNRRLAARLEEALG